MTVADDARSVVRGRVARAIERAEKAVNSYIPNAGGFLKPAQVTKLKRVRGTLADARRLAADL